jgi:hypothetical protein
MENVPLTVVQDFTFITRSFINIIVAILLFFIILLYDEMQVLLHRIEITITVCVGLFMRVICIKQESATKLLRVILIHYQRLWFFETRK